MASNPVTKLTEDEYLAIERAAELRSELVDGEMFAMAGTSRAHAVLQRNLLVELTLATEGGPCEPLGSDLKVRVSSRAYFYPDITVRCGPLQPGHENDDYIVDPVVVFEVLSPSTEKFDRGLKFQYYRTVASLQDYVLVNQDQIRIEQFTRQPDGMWILRDYQGAETQLKIDSIGVAIPLGRIYRGVEKYGIEPDHKTH